MTIGQMSEIAMLAVVPLLARSLSRKSILALGLLAYALRMALFAYVHDLGLPPMLLLVGGVALHGVCFGCFIFFAFMIIDEEAPGDVRASAQSLYNLVIVGIGIIVGSMVSTWLSDWARGAKPAFHYDDPDQTRALFSVPMWTALAVLALLLVFYPAQHRSPSSASPPRT
jgi:MFS family permease